MTRSIFTALLFAACMGAAAPASASEWWYVAHDADRVLFVDQQSIRREGPIARYWALLALQDGDGAAGETKSFMRVDCSAQTIGWLATAHYDRRDVQGEVSTRSDADADMARPDPATLDDAQRRFVCDAVHRVSSRSFPMAIDEVAFAARLIKAGATMTDPRALHDAMARDPRVPVLRSTAPDTATFGTVQTVRRGEPLVPPRDYHKGPQVPRSSDYDADTVGIVYDVAYQGVKDGEIRFEVRGYSGDDMVHPGSGQIQSVPVGETTAAIRDLAITIVTATPDAITYRVVIEKEQPVPVDACTNGACTETIEAGEPVPAERSRRK